jgi:hypothetical protein
MSKPLQIKFLGGTTLLRWIMNLLLLPAATASGMAHAQHVRHIGPNNSVAILSLSSVVDNLQTGLARVNNRGDFLVTRVERGVWPSIKRGLQRTAMLRSCGGGAFAGMAPRSF